MVNLVPCSLFSVPWPGVAFQGFSSFSLLALSHPPPLSYSLDLVLQRTIDPGASRVRPRVGRAWLLRVWPLDSAGRVRGNLGSRSGEVCTLLNPARGGPRGPEFAVACSCMFEGVEGTMQYGNRNHLNV